MKKSELFFSVLLLPVDFLMLMAAGVATYFLRTQILSSFRPVLFEFNLPFHTYVILAFFVSFVFIAFYAISGLYQSLSTRTVTESIFKVIIASSAAVMVIIVFIFLRQELFNSRFLVFGAWILAMIFVVLGRLFVRWLQKFTISKYNFGVHRILIIGNDEVTKKIIAGIEARPALGYRIVKCLLAPDISEVRNLAVDDGLDEIILTDPNYPAEGVGQLVDFCNENYMTFRFVPNIHQLLTVNFSLDVINDVPVVELKRTALDGWGRVFKRVLDIAGSAAGLVVLSPLLIIIAFAVKWETEGPVFVKLNRASRGQAFELYKFRSMMKDAEKYKKYLEDLNERKDSPLFKIKNDPRVTKVGRFIRKYRLDEFPQFFNVLTGDISLVGPRPHQPDEIAKYLKHHKRVLAIKAGVTGLAQISGSSDLPFEEEVALDTFYIENWSLWQDIKIIIITLFRLFCDRSAV